MRSIAAIPAFRSEFHSEKITPAASVRRSDSRFEFDYRETTACHPAPDLFLNLTARTGAPRGVAILITRATPKWPSIGPSSQVKVFPHVEGSGECERHGPL